MRGVVGRERNRGNKLHPGEAGEELAVGGDGEGTGQTLWRGERKGEQSTASNRERSCREEQTRRATAGSGAESGRGCSCSTNQKRRRGVPFSSRRCTRIEKLGVRGGDRRYASVCRR